MLLNRVLCAFGLTNDIADSRIETVREIMADLQFMNSWVEKIRQDIQKLRL